MLPYFFPTTVVLIDDDKNFLQSLDERLRADFVLRSFIDPLQGLNHLIGGDTKDATGIARLSTRTQHEGFDVDDPERHRELLSSLVGHVRDDPDRFDTVSVAVVDASMPDVDGLMICRALRRRPVRTVLLTGNASERVALHAFNEGAIDRFLSKHEPDFARQIQQCVRDMQHAYFRSVAFPVRQAMDTAPFDFTRDGEFLRFFDSVTTRQQSVERFLRLDPPGVDLFRSDGRMTQLIVFDGDTIGACVAAARADGADHAMIAAMETGSILTRFPTENGAFKRQYRETWREFVMPAQRVGKRWLIATLGPDATSNAPDRVSFDAFLRTREAQSASPPPRSRTGPGL